MEALNARKMETDENSSGALGAGENGGGSHQLQSPGSAREPLVEIFTSKSDCTENCNRSNCGFLFDDRLNSSDADMVCVSVDDEMEGEPPSKTQQISGGGEENVEEGVNAKGHRKEEHKMPRNLARRRRRRKIRRIPLQRRRCRYWASPGPAKHFRPFLLGPRASSINCGFLFDINCGFLFDVGLNNSDASMVCVSVDDEMEGEPPSKTQQISGGGGENVRLRRRVCERKRTSKGEAQNTKKPSSGGGGGR